MITPCIAINVKAVIPSFLCKCNFGLGLITLKPVNNEIIKFNKPAKLR